MSTLQNAMGKMTNYRWTICAMLFFATTINYLDRQVLSLTWDEFIKPEFHWNESHYGIITAVFSIVYTRVRDKDCVKNRVKRAKIVRFTLC